MLNHIDIMGRLTRDPELRHTQEGTPVCSFSVAVERDYKDASGDRGVDFVDVVAWRGTGEMVAKWFAKGRLIVVSGRLQSRKWVAQDGSNRTAWEIVAENVYFGGDKRQAEQAPPPEEAPPARTSAAPVQDFAPMPDDDGDLPF